MKNEVITAVLLLSAGTVCNAANRVFDRTVPAEPSGVVEIANVSGKIVVTGWDRPEVAVHATLEEDVERVDVTSSKGRTVIKVVLPRMAIQDSDATLEVRVPSQSELQATAVSADLETSGLLGRQRLKTINGDLRADLAAADFEGSTVSGEIRLRGNGRTANVRASTVSGDIVLERGAGDIEVTSTDGDVRLEADPARKVRMRSTSGDLVFRGRLTEGAGLEAETVSGDVTLRARGMSGLDYEASSFSGDIENCFDRNVEATSAHGPGSRLAGTIGSGKARLRARSMSGDVEICDR
jgi:DUF4097 and DUF4098 domain-containing protein YvlB